MSSSGVVSKGDIKILTQQALIDRPSLLRGIAECYQEISSTLLPENIRNEYTKNVEQVNGSHRTDSDENDNHPISLDDFDKYFSKLDQIDKELHPTIVHEPKVMGPPGMQRKAPDTMKRMGSITDVSRSLHKTSSMMNLNTKTFVEPRPPQLFKGSSTKALNAPKMADIEEASKYHVSPELLDEFNAVKDRVQTQLIAMQHGTDTNSVRLNGIWEKLKASTDRLSRFMNEFERMKTLVNDTNCNNNDRFKCVDDTFIDRLRNLVEVNRMFIFLRCCSSFLICDLLWTFFFSIFFIQALKQTRYLSENKDIYANINAVQQTDFPLSNNISEILECYYGGREW